MCQHVRGFAADHGTPRLERLAARDIREIDDERISKAQWAIVLISGMGFFTDAYDLFIIGVVAPSPTISVSRR